MPIANRRDFDAKTTRSLCDFCEKLWTSRTVLEKRLIGIAAVFVVLLSSFLIYLLVFRSPEVCTSSTCLETSMKMLNQIDGAREPCQDFYRFTCGNFMKHHNHDNSERTRAAMTTAAPDIMREEIQSRIKNILEQPLRSDQPRSLNIAKEFYRSCLNESATEIESPKWMKQIFRRMSGGWPILHQIDNDWNEKEFDWMKAVHKLKQMGINFEFFFLLSVVKDEKDPTKHILQLSDPYKNAPKLTSTDTNAKRAYLRYMEEVAVHFGSNLVNARIEQQDVLEFILKLNEISEEGKRNNMSDLYNPYVLSELQYEFRSVNWIEYINGMLSPDASISYDDVVLVPDPFYLRELEHLMLNTSKRVLANFIAWQTVQKLMDFMPTDLLHKANEYSERHAIVGTRKRHKWEICLDSVKKRMGPVISSVYIEQHFDEEIRRDVTEMAHNIKSEYLKFIEQLTWFDEKTRKMTLEKLLHISANIISYEDIERLIETAKEYDDVKIYRDNILLSALNLDQFQLRKEFGKLHRRDEGDDCEKWLEDPDFVTGLEIGLSPSDDILVFPIGLLDGVYYGKNRPNYANYGALGSIISMKIWESLTDTQYKIFNGNAKSWWTSNTLFKYDEILRCLGQSFEKRHGQDEISKADERELANLIGSKIAFKAYSTLVRKNGKEPLLPGVDFSQNQLFWIYFASPFCAKTNTEFDSSANIDFLSSPQQVLIDGITRNLQEFSENFNCKPSENFMNSNKKCNIS